MLSYVASSQHLVLGVGYVEDRMNSSPAPSFAEACIHVFEMKASDLTDMGASFYQALDNVPMKFI